LGAGPAGEPLSQLELDAWSGFLRTHATVVRELDREMAETQGLALSCYEVLLALSRAPGKRLRMRDIADSLVISRSGLTGMVGELERRGYVVRERGTVDRRGIEAVLTKTGQNAFRRAQRVHLAGIRNLFLRHLSEQQMLQLTGAWAALGATQPDPAGPQSHPPAPAGSRQ
jgi:DNA-binding MarR family transcriptional regulator